MIGAEGYGKINGLLWIGQLATIWLSIGSMWFRSPTVLPGGGNYTGMSFDTFKDNLYPQLSGTNTFQSVFALIFPAMTGIMEGANLSGDLENPGRDLGRGTLYAVFASIAHYVVLFTSFAFCLNRDTLINNAYIPMQEVGFSPYIVMVGVIIVSISAGLGSFIGGSRVLQAIARDNIFPFLRIFGKGYGKGNEPRIAVILTFALCEILLFYSITNHSIAPIMTNFFCISYGLVNVSCLILKLNGAPNFRPRFKAYSIFTCILGILLNFGLVFYFDYIKAIISFGVLIFVYVYLLYTCPQQEWGDIGQALMYHNIRKSLLKLDEKREHPKFWRPSILLWYANPSVTPLVDLCNVLKKGGLYILGDIHIDNKNLAILKAIQDHKEVLTSPHSDTPSPVGIPDNQSNPYLVKNLSRKDIIESILKDKDYYNDIIVDGKVYKEGEEAIHVAQYKHFLSGLIEHYKLKAFPQVIYADSFLSGFKNLLLTAGIGALSPNTIILPILDEAGKSINTDKSQDYYNYIDKKDNNFNLMEFEQPSLPYPSSSQYTSTIREILKLQKIAGLAMNYSTLSINSANIRWDSVIPNKKEQGYIDIYIIGDWKWEKEFDGYLSILLQFAYILHRNINWKYQKIRIIQLFDATKIYPRGRRQKVDIEQKLKDLLNEVRIEAEYEIIEVEPHDVQNKETPFNNLPTEIRSQYINNIIYSKSDKTRIIFYPLDLPPQVEDYQSDREYIHMVKTIGNNLPPIIFLNSTRNIPVITRYI
ncbi:hypothetical protein WA158_008508 [Blastocystis sp. Blastoise]